MTRPSDTRQRLLGAALALVWEHSYAATSVDAICARAGVTKGSFYHFFPSKCDLASAAIEESHAAKRALLDAAFSPLRAPLERLRALFEQTYQAQKELKATRGYVLGCPAFSLAAEVCHDHATLRAACCAVLDDYLACMASAIRDGQSAGSIGGGDPARKAQGALSLYEGALAQARIRNDPEILRELPADVFAYLGVTEPAPVH